MDMEVWQEEVIMLWWIHWVILAAQKIFQKVGKNEGLLLEGYTM
jgi:hypothetical protein